MKKILFGITSLTLGGAERVLVDLANELSNKKEYEITIFTIYGNGELEKQVSPKVKIESIYSMQYNKLPTIKRKVLVPLRILLAKNTIYNKYIKNKYDIEIAFLEGPITRIISSGKQIEKKIAWVHNDISKVFGRGIKARIKKYLDSKIYKKFSKLIFVSNNNLERFEKTYKNNISKQVIYNYIDSNTVLKKAEESMTEKFKKEQINLLTVARLVPQKALDRLIKIHSKLIKEEINNNLYIIGDGPERNKLEELIKQEKCEKTVKMLGSKENPYPYMKAADYICLLSEFEGYGMVLEEAKILNKKILITETAAKEALINYPKGTVFENSENGIYEGLKSVINREKQKENIEKNDITYNNKNIIEQIEKLLKTN